MRIKDKLVNEKTKEIVGVSITNDFATAFVTVQKAQELDIDCADCIEFLDLDELDVSVANNSVVDTAYCSAYIDDLSDVAVDRVSANQTAIYGRVYDNFRLIPLDDQYAVDRVLGKVKEW